jgi:hypothetical protein
MTTTQNPTPMFDLDTVQLHSLASFDGLITDDVTGEPVEFATVADAEAYAQANGIEEYAYVRPEQTIDGVTLTQCLFGKYLGQTFQVRANGVTGTRYAVDVFDFLGVYGVNWAGGGSQTPADGRLYARLLGVAADIADALNRKEA